MATLVTSRGAIAGNGLFACSEILPGARILEDTPLVNVSKSESLSELHELLASSGQFANFEGAEGQNIFRGDPAGRQVEEHRAWAEETLDDAMAQAERVERQRSLLAMRFNAHMDPSKTRQLLFPQISKSNHSCVPNASVYIREDHSGELICLRPIADGEEITVSYLSDQQLCMPIEYRQGRLDDVWEFTCACARCVCRYDDTRCFSCPREDCGGQCALVTVAFLNADGQATCRSCNACGMDAPEENRTSWYTVEDKVGRLMSTLPEGMYSAWFDCEEFVHAHPQHWLGSTWKRHLSAHNHREAKDADTPEEAEELRVEALQALDAADLYVQTLLGKTAESFTRQAGQRDEIDELPRPFSPGL